MDIEQMKDVVVRRYKSIVNNAREIEKIAQNCSEEVMVDENLLTQIEACKDGISIALYGFRQMLDIFRTKERNEH